MGEYTMRPATLSLHKGSHTISKMRPKIRIVHIIAPEIIKTDAENFREIVQRLTGKPADVGARGVEGKKKEEKKTAAVAPRNNVMVQQEKKEKIKCEVKVEEEGRRDDHHEVWNVDANLGGFLSFLEEDDDECFFQGISDFLHPLGSSRVDLIGETYAS